MKFLVMCAAVLLAVASLPHDASAIDRGRNIEGGFTGQGNRLTADQDLKGQKAKKPTTITTTTTKKKKDQ